MTTTEGELRIAVRELLDVLDNPMNDPSTDYTMISYVRRLDAAASRAKEVLRGGSV